MNLFCNELADFYMLLADRSCQRILKGGKNYETAGET